MNLIRKQNTILPSIMDEFFNTNWNNEARYYSKSNPAVNVIEDDKSFLLQIAAPGINKSDLEISIENKVLSIETIKNKNEENNNFTRKEFDYNSFKRSFTIPKSIETSKISATCVDGVLKIKLPKNKEDQIQSKKTIKIT